MLQYIPIVSFSDVGGGVRIGNNSIIGAGSTVLNSTSDNSIVAGNPAHIINK